MKRSEKKKRSESIDGFCKISANFKKFSNAVKRRLAKFSAIINAFIFICVFLLTCFIYLVIQTRSPLSDVLTTGRISILKDRSENMTRDVIIDLFSLSERGGVTTLTKEIIKGLVEKRPNWRFLILTARNRLNEYDYLPQSDNVKRIEVNTTPTPLIYSQYRSENRLLRVLQDKLTQLLHYDTIFCDSGCDLIWDPIGDCSLCNFVTVPRISTIHDLACFDNDPRSQVAKDKKLRTCGTTNAVKFSKKIITVSKFSQGQICNQFHVSKDFVKHIPIRLGMRVYSNANAEQSEAVLNKYKLHPQKYFIFCSAWWKNKNHFNLIQAFNKFAQKNSDIKLILVGYHRGQFRSRPIQEFSSDRIIITGVIPDKDLGILLKNAMAFIHPSVYEGFGMPIIEAMANGIPVACSNITSLPEVSGLAALHFDPFDVDSITQVMQRLAADPQLRTELIQKGYKQAEKYSDRDAMIDEYIHLMEEVMDKRN